MSPFSLAVGKALGGLLDSDVTGLVVVERSAFVELRKSENGALSLTVRRK